MDSLSRDSLNSQSLNIDSMYSDSLNLDSLDMDLLNTDSVHRGLLNIDSLFRDSLNFVALYSYLLNVDSLYTDSWKTGSLCRNSLKIVLPHSESLNTHCITVQRIIVDSLHITTDWMCMISIFIRKWIKDTKYNGEHKIIICLKWNDASHQRWEVTMPLLLYLSVILSVCTLLEFFFPLMLLNWISYISKELYFPLTTLSITMFHNLIPFKHQTASRIQSKFLTSLNLNIFDTTLYNSNGCLHFDI